MGLRPGRRLGQVGQQRGGAAPARHGPSDISMALVEAGIDRTRMGVASRGILLTDERRIITYHGAGHALVSRALPEARSAPR